MMGEKIFQLLQFLGETTARIRRLEEENEKLRTFVAFNPMTGAYSNQQLLKGELERLLAYVKRGQDSLVVFLMDIDDLNIIDETLGKNVRNKAIKEIVDAIRKCTRRMDNVFHYDPDKFILVVIIRDRDAVEAATYAHLIMRRIEEEIHKRSVQAGKTAFRLSTSTGICIADAQYPENAEEILQLANKRLHDSRTQKRSAR
jgi:diguanylate cyclase (GGDEF)-like protein